MANYKLISIKSVLPEWKARLGSTLAKVEEIDILRFANDSVERIVGGDQFIQKVALIRIHNYKASLPLGFEYVIQAAYSKSVGEPSKKEQVVQWVQDSLDTDCKAVINIECPDCDEREGNIIVNVDRLFETANPQLYTSYMNHFYGYTKVGDSSRSNINKGFKLLRRTSNNMFYAKHIPGCVNLTVDSEEEYDISNNYITTSFETGYVLLSYLSVPVDDDGYRLMPDHPIATRAVLSCIRENLMSSMWGSTGAPNDRVNYQMAIQLAEQDVARAREQLEGVDFDQLWQFVKNHMRKMVPYDDWELYYDSFKKDSFRFSKY